MLRISLVAIAAVLLGACGGMTPLSPDPVTPSQLGSAPTRVVLDGKRLTLAASLGRDFMPISPPDGKPLTGVLRIKAEDGLPVPTTIVGDSAWVIRQAEIWSTSVIPEPRESSAAWYDLRVTDGPKWNPGDTVDVVVRLRDSAGRTALLRAPDQTITASW